MAGPTNVSSGALTNILAALKDTAAALPIADARGTIARRQEEEKMASRLKGGRGEAQQVYVLPPIESPAGHPVSELEKFSSNTYFLDS